MDSDAYLASLRRELDAFEACLGLDLSAPIEHCGDWTLGDMTAHLGSGNLWAAAAITDKRGDYQAPAAAQDSTELRAWFNAASRCLLTALEVDPDTEAWTFFPPHTVRFWQRRRSLEALVHRWDAQHAVGLSSPLDLMLAGDGIAEVIDTIAPRQVQRGRATAPRQAVRFFATDTGSSWALGPGDPVATITASTEDLLLLLWGRVRVGDPAITWAGDRKAGERVLDGQLVP